MKFRRRSSEMFDGLSERDAARLEAALGQAQPTPGMPRIWTTPELEALADRLEAQVTAKRRAEALPRKRGRRA